MSGTPGSLCPKGLFAFARHNKSAGQYRNNKRDSPRCRHGQSDDSPPADILSGGRLYRSMQHGFSSFLNRRWIRFAQTGKPGSDLASACRKTVNNKKALADQGFPKGCISPDSFSGFPALLSALWGAYRRTSGRIPRCRRHLLSTGPYPHPAGL